MQLQVSGYRYAQVKLKLDPVTCNCNFDAPKLQLIQFVLYYAPLP